MSDRSHQPSDPERRAGQQIWDLRIVLDRDGNYRLATDGGSRVEGAWHIRGLFEHAIYMLDCGRMSRCCLAPVYDAHCKRCGREVS